MGCARQNIVGVWQSERVRLEFLGDGTAKGSTQAGPFTVELTGRYTFDQNGLTLIDFTSPAVNLIPPTFRDAAQLAFPKTMDYQVSWTQDGSLVLSGGGLLSGTYKRVTGAEAAPGVPDAKTPGIP